ncbi:hypothetical protein GF386_04035 [Candidatus Pacearchaeota archaeon]|nr:hypothetical protein [Candidatus Pacearchaeota archaeon]
MKTNNSNQSLGYEAMAALRLSLPNLKNPSNSTPDNYDHISPPILLKYHSSENRAEADEQPNVTMPVSSDKSGADEISNTIVIEASEIDASLFFDKNFPSEFLKEFQTYIYKLKIGEENIWKFLNIKEVEKNDTTNIN